MATTFSTFNKAPGVYIQEITLPGPLPQVSTSVAAFVGPAQMGPLNQPTLLTSFSQFTSIFGSYMEVPYRCYAAHAINGFFNEGGQQCYFVRAGNGQQASLSLLDQANLSGVIALTTSLTAAAAAAATGITVTSTTGLAANNMVMLSQGALSEDVEIASIGGPTSITLKTGLANAYPSGAKVGLIAPNTPQKTLVVTALQEGAAGDNITVQIDPATLGTAHAVVPSTTLSAAVVAGATKVTVAVATGFLPGAVVTLTSGATTEIANIASISGLTITLTAGLTHAYPSGATIDGSLVVGALQVPVDNVDNFQPGSYVKVSNSKAPDSFDVVRVVNPVSKILTLTNGLTNAYPVAPAITVTTIEFKLTVTSVTAGTEVFTGLAMDPRHSQYYLPLVTSKAVTLGPPPTPDTTPPPLSAPVTIAATNLANGADDQLSSLSPSAYQASIDALKKYDIDLLCVPDAVNSNFKTLVDTQAVQAYMVAHCQMMQDRFAILDCASPDPTDVTFSNVQAQRQGLTSNNGYAALYFPWIGVTNPFPFGSGQIYIPPSGHTAGVYAYNDNTYDVAHAPANENIATALSVSTLLSDADQGPLNQQGINIIRSFPSHGIMIWGARTIAPPDMTAWTYINVRRLVSYIEKTIREGTRFAVFQPNNITLWQQVKRLITDFLNGLWAAGDLFGATPDEAFLVRVDATLNTPVVVALGQMIAQITVVPTHPAEFVVFQVIQDPTGASLKESTT
jgi:phage tail sheath protein FI